MIWRAHGSMVAAFGPAAAPLPLGRGGAPAVGKRLLTPAAGPPRAPARLGVAGGAAPDRGRAQP
eukprot:8373336-Pyramimonas_sp.AAC.1